MGVWDGVFGMGCMVIWIGWMDGLGGLCIM
jgi:hypothetical protein